MFNRNEIKKKLNCEQQQKYKLDIEPTSRLSNEIF